MKRTPLKRNKPLQAKKSLQGHTAMKRKPMRHKPSKANRAYTKELRAFIRERDVYCQICGGRGDQIHHVISRARYKAHPERYSISNVHDECNLMFVCFRCHNAITDNRNGEYEHAIGVQEDRFGPLRRDFIKELSEVTV